MKQIIAWLTDIYAEYGWQAALIVLVVIVALLVVVVLALGVDIGNLAQWLERF